MALFHIVASGIFKSKSNMGCIEHCKLSKMSKNSLRSFLSRENRRDEVRVLSLELQGILWWTKFKFKVMLHKLYFAGLKLVRHSIINCLHNCYRSHFKHSLQGHALYPFWEESAHCHFDKVTFCIKLVLELCTCSFLIIHVL